MRRAALTLLLTLSTAPLLHAQNPAPSLTPPASPDPLSHQPTLSPIANPTFSPGVLELLKLEGQFSADVARRGGAAFASWFAEDGVSLSNGKAAVLGLHSITASAQWDPRDYQLSWYPEGAQMGPSGDTGFTWGHYDANSKDAHGNPVHTSGRYITFWKKVAGKWKVALDAGAN
ncbi:MAG: nuclear transport factor 2 family protein, partial [Acidobacteriota bacterium]